MTAVPPPTGPEDDGELSPAPPGATTSARRSSRRNLIEWGLVVGGSVLVALIVRGLLLQAFYIPSESMVPTLRVRDRVLVNKLSYRFDEVERGDIVVFERPPNETADIKDLIKRVVGLPGETVEGRDGTVFIDGAPLDESYLPEGTVTSEFGPVLVGADEVWVMGDNRSNSSDSRVFGPISEDLIVGRAFLRIWPLSRIGLL